MKSIRQARAQIRDPLERVGLFLRQRYDRLFEAPDTPLVTPGAPPIHPRRAYLHVSATLGDRAADVLAASMGSWGYLGIQTCFIALWMMLNTVAFINHWDERPYILLNLIFSIQASYAAPILQLAGNRTAARDRARDDAEAREVEEILTTNRQTIEILQGQDEQMARTWEMIELLHQLLAEQHRGKGHTAA